MDTSDLAKRMKDYERRNRYYLQRRMPVILRLDMRSGHSFTRGFQRPFDEIFIKAMQETAKYLCENMQNVKCSYQQSDEITLVLVDYEKLNSDCFFEYRVDKLCSIAASMATMAFNKFFANNFYNLEQDYAIEHETNGWYGKGTPEYEICETYSKAVDKGAMFDCRCFNIPKEEVTNCIYWRQLDATRNSIQMVGQAYFSHKELQHKTCNQIQDMLMTQKGINWNDLKTSYKRGSCCVRNRRVISVSADGTETCELRNPKKSEREWIIDTEIPIFKGDGRKYIDELVYIEATE